MPAGHPRKRKGVPNPSQLYRLGPIRLRPREIHRRAVVGPGRWWGNRPAYKSDEFWLDDWVPVDPLLRKIADVLDLSGLRHTLAPFYSHDKTQTVISRRNGTNDGCRSQDFVPGAGHI